MRVTELFIHRCEKTGKVLGLKRPKGWYRILFFIVGFLSLIWFLIRVIPKPSRASYPCMKATMPIAFSFVAYLATLAGSVVFYRKAFNKIRERRFRLAFGIFLIAGLFTSLAIMHNVNKANAMIEPTVDFEDPLGPNQPVGDPKGIFPGRVVWVLDMDATNINCTNTSQSDAYWLTNNTDQDVVDNMFSEGIRSLTSDETDSAAWDAIFHYFNLNHGKGDVGYTDTETIFIKINAVTAHGGAWPSGNMSPSRGVEYDTSPETILTMLRQLVNNAGVPQDKIFIGDPMADIYNHIYDYLHAEFPDVNYCTQYGIPNRYSLHKSSTIAIHFSDGGTVMPQESNDSKLFTEMMDADYILNIPTMKGHRWAGVTFFAKNHFGSNTADGSWYMHPGLINNDNNGMRTDYKMYRVLVDLMGSQYLGRKTLLFFMEGLWSTSYEHQMPQKFQTSPWNNDWSSSLLFSLDPVAIESVGLDILQKEFTVKDSIDGWDGPIPDRWTFVQYGAVDDYLYQAASSDWWPDGITYDPDNSGSALPSLGVHEHWNNVDDMEYSRNLGTGDGIELVKLFHIPPVTIRDVTNPFNAMICPNPCNSVAMLSFSLKDASDVVVEVYNVSGEKIYSQQIAALAAGNHDIGVNVERWIKGVYYCILQSETHAGIVKSTQKLIVN